MRKDSEKRGAEEKARKRKMVRVAGEQPEWSTISS